MPELPVMTDEVILKTYGYLTGVPVVPTAHFVMITALIIIGIGLVVFCFKFDIGVKKLVRYVPEQGFDKTAVYWKIRTHLLAQDAKAATKEGSCKYRNEAGLQCAVGCLIPDELYKPWMEGQTAHGVDIQNVLAKIFGRSLNDTELTFLRDLQTIHDSHLPKSWKRRLDEFAEREHIQLGCRFA